MAHSLRASLKTCGDGLLKAEGLDGDAVFLHVEPLLRAARRSLGRDDRRENWMLHPSRHVFDVARPGQVDYCGVRDAPIA